MNWGKSMSPQFYTKNYKQLRSNSWRRAHGYGEVILYQMANLQNLHTSNIIKADQVVIMCFGIYKYIHIHTCMYQQLLKIRGHKGDKVAAYGKLRRVEK